MWVWLYSRGQCFWLQGSALIYHQENELFERVLIIYENHYEITWPISILWRGVWKVIENIQNHYEINWLLTILWRRLFVHARGYNYMFFLLFYFLNISAAYIVPYCLLDNRSGIKLLNAAVLTKWLGPIFLTPCEIYINAIFFISIRFFIISLMHLQCEFLLCFGKSRG